MSGFDELSHERQLQCLLDVASKATAHYDLPAGVTPSLINLSENATYKIEDPASDKKWALRVHREGYHSPKAIASELAWLIALRRGKVVTTPVPISGKDRKLIQSVAHPMMQRPRNVVLFEWETGFEPGIGDEELAGPLEILGELTARMHIHARAWKRPPDFERLIWDFETSIGSKPHWGRWQDGMGLDGKKTELFSRTVKLIGERLRRYGKSGDRFGLIHGDLRLANLLIDGKDVKVIDFDDSGFGWFMYDAATPVSFYEHDPKVPDLIQSWLKGYKRASDLPKEDEEEIPTFIMLRRILLVAWIGSHSETELARSMGVPYTEGTVGLCEQYLREFG
jgi:Ser/Thr protein kinase RdoA (MazF antagonist)